MSLVGKVPINVPSGVEVRIAGDQITVKGPLGELSERFDRRLKVEHSGEAITVTRDSDEPEVKARHGLWRSLISNMVVGVSAGFEKRLELIGTGYRVKKSGKAIELSLGLSHPVVVEPLGSNELVPEGMLVVIKGKSKQQVGEQAASIRKLRKPNPFTGKGIKYVDEVIRRKAGKKAGKGEE